MGFFQKGRGKGRPAGAGGQKGGRPFNGKPFQKRGFDGGKGGYGGGSGDRQSFDVTCADCGRETTVPFRPTGSKPVLCRDCFRGSEDGGPKRKSFDRGPKRSFDRGEKRGWDKPERAPRRDDGMERRLNDMSRKIDLLLEEVSAIREFMSQIEVMDDGVDADTSEEDNKGDLNLE